MNPALSSLIQAIVTKSYTVTAKFSGVPDEATRKSLFDQGFRWRNGQWLKNEQQHELVSEEEVAARVAA